MVEIKKGRPISMSFLDLFVTPKPRSSGLLHRHDTIGRDASGRPALVRTRKKVNYKNFIRRFVVALCSSQCQTPVSLTQVQAPKKSHASSTGSTKAEPPASPKAEEPPVTEATVCTWTVVEDAALLGLKAQRKSWKEISETMAGKDLEAIKERYRLLYDLAPAEVKSKEAEAKEKSNEGEAKEGDGGKMAKDGGERGNDGGKKGKGKSNEESKKGSKTPTSNKGRNKEYADEELSTEDVRTPFSLMIRRMLTLVPQDH